MATKRQISANRTNAQKSTGPRTNAGKTQSALNARKHGFAGTSFSVIRLDDVKEVDALRADALAFYQPINSQEIFAVERIALCQMALLRIARMESGLLTHCLDRCLGPEGEHVSFMSNATAGDGDIQVTRAQNRNYAVATGFHMDTFKPHTWELFLRYQTQAERQYRRAIEDLNRLIALRPPEDETTESPNEPNFVEPDPTQLDPVVIPFNIHPPLESDPASPDARLDLSQSHERQ